MNDADLQQHEYERQGNIIASLRKKGICLHGSRKGPGDPFETGIMFSCLDCGKVATWDALDEERNDYL